MKSAVRKSFMVVYYFMMINIVNAQTIRLEDLDPALRQQILNSGISSDQVQELMEENSEDINEQNILPANEKDIGDQIRDDILNEISIDRSINDALIDTNLVKDKKENLDDEKKEDELLTDQIKNNLKDKRSNELQEKLDAMEIEKMYFGYNTFDTDPRIFQKSDFGSIDPGYIVGPGDEIIIML